LDPDLDRAFSALVLAGRALSPWPPQPDDHAAGLAAALTRGLPGAPDPSAYDLGLAIGDAPHPWPGLTGASATPNPPAGEPYSGLVPRSSLVYDLPDLTLDPQADTDQANKPSAPAGTSSSNVRPSLYDTWTLPNGQVVRQYDSVQDQNAVYHHGDLAGAPGVYVDDPFSPDRPSTVFTPTGLGVATPDHGFSRSPQTAPDGSPYFNKVVWRNGGRDAVLQIDAQGAPVRVYVRDAGEAHDAPSPIDAIGPGEIKLPLEFGLAVAAKAGAPALFKGLGAKLAAASLGTLGHSAEELTGPVVYKGLSDLTAEEQAQFQAYLDGANEAAQLGLLSPTGRVTTTGPIEQAAKKLAMAERKRAAEDGIPYQGDAGHVPDKTWTGDPAPYKWLDMSPRLNASLGAQARRYPLGYKPTEFKAGDD
jgi:hypothetical protein